MTNTPATAPIRPVRRRASLITIPFLTLGLVSMPFTAAQAADGTWNTDAAGNWNTTNTSPWSGGTIAQGADFTADFSTVNITSNRTVTLTEAMTIGNLKFGDLTTVDKDWTLASSGGSILTLDTTTGTAPIINVVNRTATISAILAGSDGMTKIGSGTLILTGAHTYTGTTTISAGKLQLGTSNAGGSVTGDIVNNGSLEVQGGNSAATILNGVISGSGTLTKLNSASSLTLMGNNTYSGATTLSDGTLLLGHNNALGSSTLTVSRGRLGSADSERNIANTVYFNLTGGLTLGATQGAATGTGDITFTSTAAGTGNAITVNNATTASLSTQFTGGFITKGGTGTLVLNGANSTYTGATKINGGVLSVGKLANINTASSIGKGSSSGSATDLILAGGTLRFTGASSGSTNRMFSLAYGTNGASSVLDSSGDDPMQFTGTGDIGVANNTANTPWSSADISAGTTQFTMNDVSQVAVGMGVTGTNIAAGTYVSAIDTANKKITLSQGLTAGIIADGSLTFSFYGGPRTLTLTGTNTGANTLAANLTDSPESNGSQSSQLSHAASLVKDGSGMWIITGAHTYTGTTTVNAGMLVVNGSIGSGSAVTINGGMLGGSGVIGGTVTFAGGTLSPGNSPGTLTIGGNLLATSASILAMEIGSTVDSYDSLKIGGDFTATNFTLNFTNPISVTLSDGDTFSLFLDLSGNSTSIAGTFSAIYLPTLADGLTWDQSALYSDGVLSVSAIPEPSTYAAIAGALALGAVLIRRRRRAQT